MINSASESSSNKYNFYIHWFRLSFGSSRQTLPSSLIQLLIWYILSHRSVGQIIMMWSKCFLYSLFINFEKRFEKTLFPQSVGPVNIAEYASAWPANVNLWYSLSLLFVPYMYQHTEHISVTHTKSTTASITSIHCINYTVLRFLVHSNIVWYTLRTRDNLCSFCSLEGWETI